MTPSEGDATHKWFWFKSYWECCKDCGVCRRADRQNSPCKGKVKVTLRGGL